MAENNLLIDDTEEEIARKNREEFEKALSAANGNTPNVWQYSSKGLEAKQAAMTMLSTKTGMYARIPLVCKGDNCPYSGQCQLLPYDMAPEGEYCPMETAQIELRSNAYAQEFDLDSMSFTDKALLNEIIGFDIMLERCRAHMAKEGTPVIEITAGIAENGEEIRQPTVSKAWEAYEKISKKRDADYQLMLMTRKDKNKNGEKNDESPVTELINKIDTIDISVDEKK